MVSAQQVLVRPGSQVVSPQQLHTPTTTTPTQFDISTLLTSIMPFHVGNGNADDEAPDGWYGSRQLKG